MANSDESEPMLACLAQRKACFYRFPNELRNGYALAARFSLKGGVNVVR